MNEVFKKLKLIIKPKNEDWVSRVLKKRQKKPWIIGLVIILVIFMYSSYNSYGHINELLTKQNDSKEKIKQYKKKMNTMNTLLINQESKIDELKDLVVKNKKPIAIITKVCELLKSKDVIGSFYIIKKKSKEYVNVLSIEVQISYGDKDLLFTIIQLVMDKVFYLKDIQKTTLGVKCEIYKPAK